MAQIFHRSSNSLAKVSIAAALLTVSGIVWAAYKLDQGSFNTLVDVAREQPIPFSHKHHVGDDGIDCRYCHTSVETSSFAGIPPTKTCMNCHSQVWSDSPALAPVRDSFRDDRSIQWIRVHNLPGFVYFDHSIHIHQGIGCVSCHGRIDEMPFTYQVPSLLMEWCLDCHHHPEQHIRPREQVFNMRWQPSDERDESGQPYDQLTLGRELVRKYEIKDSTRI